MNIIIAGVGGQGSLLAARIIGNVAIKLGYDVKVSEVHGMSQRGGSVITYVKYSDKEVHSPIMDAGTADVMIAFEQLEAYRNISFLKENAIILMNTQKIDPMPVITGAFEYPIEIAEKIAKNYNVKLTTIDALEKAKEAGSVKAVNMVLLGLLASKLKLDIDKQIWLDVMAESVKEKFLASNLAAFELGYESGAGA